MKPESLTSNRPGMRPLLVQVERDGSLVVDYHRVSWEDFASLVQKELGRRPPSWPVYVEGDPDLEWRRVAEIVDAIRGLRADVVLLKTR